MLPILLGIALAAAAAGVAAWRLLFPPAVPNVAIVFDGSRSQSFDCEVVPALAARALEVPGAAPRSRLFFIVTGDSSSAHAGRLVASVGLPVRHSATRIQWEAERRQAFFDDLRRRCEALSSRDESPILGAIASAVAELRSSGCRPPVACHLYVATDGQESVDAELRAALRGEPHHRRAPQPAVDNTGITVSFCGFGQPTPRSRVTRANGAGRDRLGRMTRAWSSQFSAPELVAVAPYCQTE